MKKNAILVRGEPIITEDVEDFKYKADRDSRIMKEIAVAQGYNVLESSLKEIQGSIQKSFESDKFLFYFVGHSNKDYMGTLDYRTNDILEMVGKIKGEKLIILDSCVGDYEGGENFESLNLPNNSKTIGAKYIFPKYSLAKLVHDASIRGTKLEDLEKSTFEEMKHNWVYVKEQKN